MSALLASGYWTRTRILVAGVAVALVAVVMVTSLIQGLRGAGASAGASGARSAVPDFPAGVTECDASTAVTGVLSCEFAVKVAEQFSQRPDPAAPSHTLESVEDPVRGRSFMVVCAVAPLTECAMGPDGSIYLR